MTTQDQHTDALDSTGEVVEPETKGLDQPVTATEAAPIEGAAPTEAEAVPPAPAEPPASTEAAAPTDEVPAQTGAPVERLETSTAEADSATEEKALFAEDDLSRLRSSWNDVQAGFVDDPRECVHKADGLVSDVVDQLTAGFAEARSRLEEQWARGEEASTEDLRLALKRYREFFERLLAV